MSLRQQRTVYVWRVYFALTWAFLVGLTVGLGIGRFA